MNPSDQNNTNIILESKSKSPRQSIDLYKLKQELNKGPYLYRRQDNQRESKGKDTYWFGVAIFLIISMFISNTIVCIELSLYLIMSSLLIPYLLLVVSYYKTVRTHPGTCVDYQPHCSENEKQEAIERETYGKEKNFKIVDIGYPCRYCSICKKFQCERSYHCKKCGYCILNRDHHCPWILQCVGKYNLKYFIQLLVYVPINCIVGIILHISNIVSIVRDPNTSKSVHALNISLSLSSTVIMFSMGIAVSLKIRIL